MGREHAARATMDDERDVSRRANNPSFVDRAREDAARSGARVSAGARATTMVRRHRAGVATGAAVTEEEEEEDALGFVTAGGRGRGSSGAYDDEDGEGDDDDDDIPAERVRRSVARRAGTPESGGSDESESESEDEEARDARRAAMRARAAAREAEEAREDAADEDEDEDVGRGGQIAVRGAGMVGADAGDEESGSSSYETDSEYETDSDESSGGGGPRKLFKPVFVRKSERDTIEEREKMQAEIDAEAAMTEAARTAKREESKKLVELEVRREEALAAALDEMEPSDVDTDDELDDALEFEAWKGRELERLKTDRIQREQMFREREEQERIRNMTEDERNLYHAKRLAEKEHAEKDKPKMAFMQKYFHKGAFFQEAADDAFGTAGPDEIYKRDFNAPTAEEKYDKSLLPSAMQVRKGTFGRAGQSKWTHLANEDTSVRKDETDDLWSGKNRDVRAIKDKMTAKQGGLKDSRR
jgi:microfibrillar-associated protein 1